MRVLTSLLALQLLATPSFAYSPSYAPFEVSCPKDANFVRDASSVSESEAEWLDIRHNVTDGALAVFLNRADFQDFNTQDFIDSLNRSINIGLTFSGGGYRAMLNGAGQIAALDDRTEGANDHGLGGLLQASTYLVGLSGGNWLSGTLALNNWTSIQSILGDDTIWNLENSIVNPGGDNMNLTAARWQEIGIALNQKAAAGFDTSITDIWGRALSYQFFGTQNNGSVGLSFSDIREYVSFQNGEMPFPISVSLGRVPGSDLISLNSTVFEFNPFELGSWDPSLYAFTDLLYVGSEVSNGEPVTDICIQGYDNGGLVLGTSSNVFNVIPLNGSGIPEEFVAALLGGLEQDDDYALFSPNPFYDTDFASTRSIVQSETLYLFDGGFDGQNVPFAPLLQPERDVDVIFAFDNSDNTEDAFPDGSTLGATYDRQFYRQGNGTSFPYVPSSDSILAHGLNEKPLFLGCDASNLTGLASIPPLVVYIPNIAYTAWSNTSTLQLSYSNEERDALIQNGFEAATRYNLTIDSNWPTCVACAIIRREQERNGWEQPTECEECFQEYCWDGVQYNGTEEVLSRSLNYTSQSNLTDYSSTGETSLDANSTSTETEASGTATATDGSTSSTSSVSTNGVPILTPSLMALAIPFVAVIPLLSLSMT